MIQFVFKSAPLRVCVSRVYRRGSLVSKHDHSPVPACARPNTQLHPRAAVPLVGTRVQCGACGWGGVRAAHLLSRRLVSTGARSRG